LGDHAGWVGEAIVTELAGELDDIDAGGHECCEIRERREVERRIGAGGDDELGSEGDLGGAAPVMEGLQGIGSDEKKELSIRGEGSAETGKGVDCVVGLGVAGDAGVGEGELEAGMILDGETGHGDAVFEACGRALGLEGLEAYGGEDDSVEA
jgi:hypothetical protein